MNIKELIEALQKMPTETQLQPVCIKSRYDQPEVVSARWDGNKVTLEAEHG
jgi:hypothetical protein